MGKCLLIPWYLDIWIIYFVVFFKAVFKKLFGVLNDPLSLICVYDASWYFHILQIWSNTHFGASDVVFNIHTDFRLEIVQPLGTYYIES